RPAHEHQFAGRSSAMRPNAHPNVRARPRQLLLIAFYSQLWNMSYTWNVFN
ncbi:hypothetical protein HMPREF0294_0871, partial [Corynebacterium glucuronolyticum ATCC 51867]